MKVKTGQYELSLYKKTPFSLKQHIYQIITKIAFSKSDLCSQILSSCLDIFTIDLRVYPSILVTSADVQSCAHNVHKGQIQTPVTILT